MLPALPLWESSRARGFACAIASLLERSERGEGKRREYPSVEDSPPPDRLAPVDLPARGRYENWHAGGVS